jgi:phospholipase D3/4
MITDANTDWRSFTQVKEVGVALEGSPGFLAAKDLQLYFDRWWTWTDPTFKRSLQGLRMQVFDPYLQHTRFVPCFSKFGDHSPRNHGLTCKSPFNSSSETVYNFANPMPLVLNNIVGRTFLSCSPPEVCDTPDAVYSQSTRALEGRTWDGDALVQTILSAREHVSLSTMYYVPSAYTSFLENPAWWPALSDALLTKVAQGVRVRLLISQWTDAYKSMPGYLRALQSSAEANAMYAQHYGSIEVRYFALPGWKNATGPADEYPKYSRVNHGKYIVTDTRFNIGTNEMEWSFFFNTAGTSFNSDHPLLRRQLQDVFDRDWNSDYAKPLSTGESDDSGNRIFHV